MHICISVNVTIVWNAFFDSKKLKKKLKKVFLFNKIYMQKKILNCYLDNDIRYLKWQTANKKIVVI